MITGVVTNQYPGCPPPCGYILLFEDLVTGAQQIIIADPNTGAYTLPPTFNYSDNPIQITVYQCTGNAPLIEREIYYRETFRFPRSQSGLQRVWEDLNIVIVDPEAVDCQAPARNPTPTLCGFYVVEDTCNNLICVYNTQQTNYTRISYDFGNGYVERNFISGCYAYESYGNYIITQTVELIINGQVVATAVCQSEPVTPRKRVPDVSLYVERDSCCPEDCNEFRNYCIDVGDCVKITPVWDINDEDCCSEAVLPPQDPANDPPVVDIDCEILDPICIRSLSVRNYEVDNNVAQPLFPNVAEYVLVQKQPSYNLSTGPFTFEFELGREFFMNWAQPLGNYPANSPRVIWAWQSDDLPCNMQTQAPKIELHCLYTFDDRISFTILQTCPQQSEMTIFTQPNLANLFPPPQPLKIAIVKGNAAMSNSRLNYTIYVNGVDVTDYNLFIDTLNPGFDDLGLVEGALAFGVMWHRQSLTKVNAMAPLNLPIAFGQGIAHNYGLFDIRAFRFYGRSLTQDEILRYAQANCATDGVSMDALLMWLDFDQRSGDVVPERISMNNGQLFNYGLPRQLPNDAPNNDSAWINYCCNDITARLVVTRPDGTVDDRTWNAPGYYCFDIPGEYTLSLEVCNCCDCCTHERKFIVGPKLYIERIDCYAFRLVDRNVYFEDYRLQLKVFDTQGQEILNQEHVPYRGDTDFEIYLPYDGIFLLEYRLYNIPAANSAPDLLYVQRFVLVDFCKILECYSKLLQTINCTDCNQCLEDLRLHRINFNKVNMLLLNFQGFLYNLVIHYGLSEGAFVYDDKYLTFVKEARYYIEQLLILCGKCNYIGNYKTPIKCLPVKRLGCCGQIQG